MIKKLFIFFMLMVPLNGILSIPSTAQQIGAQHNLATVPLTILSGDTRHQFTVELAVTFQEQAVGMMFRKEIAPDEGMFFIYTEPERKGFWMKNTFIPLDIIYIREDGRIANIIRNAEPHSTNPRMSRGPVLAVLEIAGGRAKELGIRPGDKVLHRIFEKNQ